MPTLRGWLIGLSLAMLGSVQAAAGDVHVEKRDATSGEVLATIARYGSLPGGVILEGSAPGIGIVSSASYDAASGDVKIDGKLSFKPNISPVALAQLARAIAADDRIGVSIAEDDVISYGAMPLDSTAARDLAVADTFLADLILPPREWTLGYRFADGYQPKEADSEDDFIVLFRFQDFDFTVADGTLTPTDAKIDIVIVPVSAEKAPDGGYLAKSEALSAGIKSQAIEDNAKHVGENFSYYLKERAATRAIAMGRAAALLRHLKASNVDLIALAGEIEKTSPQPTEPAWTSLTDAWNAYIAEIKADNDYANWSDLRTTALTPAPAP